MAPTQSVVTRFRSAMRRHAAPAIGALALLAAGAAGLAVPAATAGAQTRVTPIEAPVRTEYTSNRSIYDLGTFSDKPATQLLLDVTRNIIFFADGEGYLARAPRTLSTAVALPTRTMGSLDARYNRVTQSVAQSLAQEPTRVFGMQSGALWEGDLVQSVRHGPGDPAAGIPRNLVVAPGRAATPKTSSGRPSVADEMGQEGKNAVRNTALGVVDDATRAARYLIQENASQEVKRFLRRLK